MSTPDDALLRSLGYTPEARAETSHRLAGSTSVDEGLANRYQICATMVNIFGSQAQRDSGAEVQAARCAVRDAVCEKGLRHASVLPLLEKLRAALAAPAADAADEAGRVAADIAFLRGEEGANSEAETWLSALLYTAKYLAPNDKAAALSILPRIAQLSGRPAELFWHMGERRWLVRDSASGEEITPPLPAAQRCARPGCTARGTKICTGCRVVKYCGRECSVAHWKLKPGGHKAACRAASTQASAA